MLTVKPYFHSYSVVGRIGGRPISAIEVADHIKIEHELIDVDLQAYIESLIDSAVLFAEKYTKRTLIESNMVAYLDYFISGQAYEVRISPLNSVASFQYYSGGTLETIDTANYYLTESNRFRRIAPVTGYTWPNSDDRLQSIVLNTVGGYTELPIDMKHAILGHVAALYSNRGDCNESCNVCSLPVATRNVYNAYKIKDLFIGV